MNEINEEPIWHRGGTGVIVSDVPWLDCPASNLYVVVMIPMGTLHTGENLS